MNCDVHAKRFKQTQENKNKHNRYLLVSQYSGNRLKIVLGNQRASRTLLFHTFYTISCSGLKHGIVIDSNKCEFKENCFIFTSQLSGHTHETPNNSI